MVYPITNFERVWVRGRFVDLAKAAREETAYATTGPVQFVPKTPVTLNYASQQIIAMRPFVVWPDPTTGYFQIQLPVTDDPDVNPTDFKYEVTEPTGRKYNIKVPIDTPTLFAPGDPLDGKQVIELVNVVPDPENPGGTVQLLKGLTGRGVETVTIRPTDKHLIVGYDDGLTYDAGVMPVASVNGISGGDIVFTKADLGLGNADNTSDANKPVSTAQATALAGKQALNTNLTAISGLSPANDDILQRKAGAWINRTPVQLKADLALAKGDVALGNVDNTSDANKPVSTATQTALNGKANSSHTHAASDINSGQFSTDRMPQVSSTVRAVTGATGAITPDATVVGNNLDYTASGNVTFNPPTGGANRQVLRIAVLASGADRTVTFAAGIRIGSGITRGPLTVTSGQVLLAALEYSTLINAWVLTATTISAS